MTNRKILSLIVAMAAGASAVLMAPPAASAQSPLPDFRLGIQVFDNRGVSGDSEPLFTDPVGLTPVVTTTGWAKDSNGVDPDGFRVALKLEPDAFPLPADIDFRVGAQARDLPEPEDGAIRFTPWASEAGEASDHRGETGFVTDLNGFDPDQYRLLIQVRALPEGARPIADFRLYVNAGDRFEPDGDRQFTPFASEGGGVSPIAFDHNRFRPDGIRVGLEVSLVEPGSR
jgi:hypothetical protein